MSVIGKLPTDVVAFCQVAEQGYHDMLANERRAYPANHNRASSLGHPCVRYIYLQRTRGHEADLPSVQLQGIFRQGKHIEQATIRELQEMGLEWVWGERPFIDDKHCISGNVDGGVRVQHGVVIPGEIKSMQGPAWEAVRPGPDGLKDLLNHRSWFIRKYPVQAALYIHLSGEEQAMLVLRDKWFWRLRLVPIRRPDVEHVIREAIEKADKVNQAIADGNIPPRITYDDAVCGRCDFRAICLPGRQGAGTAWVDDPKLLDQLAERDHLKTVADRFRDLDTSLKARLKATGEPEFVVGGQYLVTNRKQMKKRMQATGEEYEITVTSIRELEQPLVPIHGAGHQEGDDHE